MKGVKDLIQDLAFEHGLTTHDVEMMIRSEFKLVMTEAAKKEMKPVRLMYFGVFGVKPYRKIFMEEKLRLKNEAKNKENEVK